MATSGFELRFPLDKVLTAAEDAAATTEFRTFYDEPTTGPCLVLTAQYGIYLMSNALKPRGTEAVRAFADGWDEDTDPAGYLDYCGVLDLIPLDQPQRDDAEPLIDALRAAARDDTHLVLTFGSDRTHYIVDTQ